MRGGPLHSKRIGYRFRSFPARLVSPVRLLEFIDLESVREDNLRAGIAEAAELECTCGLERAHRTAAPGCRLRNLPR